MGYIFSKSTRSAAVAKIALWATLLPLGIPPSVAALAADQSGWNRPADLVAIRSIEDRMVDASDGAGLASDVAENAVLVDAYVPAVSRGRSRVLAAWRQDRAALAGSTGRYTEISVISTPGFACSASQIRYAVKKAGTPAIPAEYRRLDVFKKIGGRWQLIQQHVSAAIDRQTGMVTTAPLPVRGPLAWDTASFSTVPISPVAGRAGIVDWTNRALREVGLEAAMQYFAPGPDMLLYGEYNPGNIRTRAEATAYYGPLYKSFSGLHVVSPLYEADSDGLLGAQIDTQDITIAMNDGSKPQLSLRQSDCLRQYGGKWQSFMEMVSFPVERATGKAVMRSAEFRTQ